MAGPTAVSLTKSLRYDIQSLGQRLAELNSQSGIERRNRTKEDIKVVMDDIKLLLDRIEDVSSHCPSDHPVFLAVCPSLNHLFAPFVYRFIWRSRVFRAPAPCPR